jgi:hypothetical protein
MSVLSVIGSCSPGGLLRDDGRLAARVSGMDRTVTRRGIHAGAAAAC